MIRPHVVVDGSNLATEGRTTPSLGQLDDAVRAFLAEHTVETLIVVVDASFPNRIDPSERADYEAALAAGELVTPPAGTIGRGDAFILQIAEKVDATVLSNDSFQELHVKHPWLFEPDRLIGGKPVTAVGWVFLPRTPVRGPVSKRVTRAASKGAKGAEQATPTDTGSKTSTGSKTTRKKKGATATDPAPTGPSETVAATDRATKGAAKRSRKKSTSAGVEPLNEALPFIEFVSAHPLGSEVVGIVDSFSSHGAYVTASGVRCYVPLKRMGDPAPRAARDVMSLGDELRFIVDSIDTPRRGIDLALAAASGSTSAPTRGGRSSRAPKRGDDANSPNRDANVTTVLRASSSRTTRGGQRSPTAQDAFVEVESTQLDEHAEEAMMAAVKKRATRKSTAKRTTKKSASKRTAKKAPARKKKAAAKRTAKKAPARKKKAAAKRTAKKAPARKKKAAAKRTAKKAPARKKKAAAKRTAKKAPARKKKAAAKRAPARRKKAAARR